jgi:hypothetical protein
MLKGHIMLKTLHHAATKTRFGTTGRLASRLLLLLAAAASPFAAAEETAPKSVLIHAARLFDGENFRTDTSVLVSGGQVVQIDARDAFKSVDAQTVDLGDATILPGFIELHAHLAFQRIPADTVLKHGITTLRDVGGPVHRPYGGDGSLRVLTSGLIITAPGGYPIPGMGETDIATPVATEQQARETVRTLIDGGAAVIKVALEPGGEPGAPWSAGHGHAHGRHAAAEREKPRHKTKRQAVHKQPAWPLLPENIVMAIVDEAHKHGRKVTAHIAEEQGARIALNAGIDEWAHAPCDALPDELLKKAAAQRVTVIGTLDTLSKCPDIAHNAGALAALGVEFLYGSEVAHPDIPWGIDAQELIYMMHMAHMPPLEVLRAATSRAGRHLNIPLLGSLQPGAPADLIAVKGDPMQSFKILEYPGLVMSGGKIVVNDFAVRMTSHLP